MSEHDVFYLQFNTGRSSDDALQTSRKTDKLFHAQPTDFVLLYLLRLALSIDGDAACIEEWYWSTRIREFGGLTAHELVCQGDSELVMNFLWSIKRGERD